MHAVPDSPVFACVGNYRRFSATTSYLPVSLWVICSNKRLQSRGTSLRSPRLWYHLDEQEWT